MSTDDRSGYLPPHELRALFAQVVDRGEAGGVPPTPGPSIALSTPGLAGAAATPPGAPAFAADDPNTIGIMLARMANELMGASLVPAPTPESLTTGAGMSSPVSPGGAPQMIAGVPGAPSIATDAITPQLVAQAATGGMAETPASPSVAGGPSGSPAAESPIGHGGTATGQGPASPDRAASRSGTQVQGWGTPGEVREPDFVGVLGDPVGFSTVPLGLDREAGHRPPATGNRQFQSALHGGEGREQWQSAPTSSIASAVPGRPAGLGMPASNAASPGGMPGVPASVMPTAPAMPFASSAEHAGNAALGRFGAVPPIGEGTLPTTTLPAAHELEGFAGALPVGASTPPIASYATSPSPNAMPDGAVGRPETPTGPTPFQPTNLEGWSPYGSSDHGFGARLPLIGDQPLAIAPVTPPELSIPLTDDRALDAAPGFVPQGDQGPKHAPAITGGESLRHGEPAIRQLGGTAFDPYVVRRDFPILEERVHGGKRLVWLDNAATTQKPRAVIDRLTHYYEHENSNVHRAAHTLAARATDAFESGRESTRKFLNAPSTQEIVFVRGATEGINLIANTWGVKHVGAGDEILITHLEHHANIVPWQMLCARVGAKLRVAPVDDRGDVILSEYERLIGPRTRLVAFTQVSNALGTITPAREMVEIAHRHGACVMVDGAQAVSHMPVDVQQLGCDFYVFSGHKVFAPTGIGAIYGKRELLEDMPPWQGGGNMIADVTFEKTVYQGPPWRFEAGTGNIADAAGLGAALDYVMRIGMNVIDRYEHDLLVYATEKLVRIPGLRMIGTSATKASVLSFVLEGQRTEDVGAALDKEGIAVRSGHHCAQPILRRFGLEASVRASLAFYNVCEDVDALVDAVTRLQMHRRSVSVPG